jgi:hypothetical protein
MVKARLCAVLGTRFPVNEGIVFGRVFVSSKALTESLVVCLGSKLLVDKAQTELYTSPRSSQRHGIYSNAYMELNFVRCSVDGKLYHKGDVDTDRNGRLINAHLTSSEWTVCRSSGVFILRADAVNISGYSYHPDHLPAYVDIEGYRTGVSDYSYKPYPTFLGGTQRDLVLGVELEADHGGQSDTNAKKILAIANRGVSTHGHLYIKGDGSLDSGFEMVSQPATLEYHTNTIPWADILDKAIEMGYRSHQTDTSGLHAHIPRKYFGETEAEQDTGIMCLLFLFEKFWNEIVTFSRRSNSQISSWARRYGLNHGETPPQLLNKAKRDIARYRAVNLSNMNTIELRLFRGSLRYETFLGTLQFITLLAQTSKEVGIAEIMSLTWNDLISRGLQYRELQAYLRTRGIGLPTTVAEPDAVEV